MHQLVLIILLLHVLIKQNLLALITIHHFVQMAPNQTHQKWREVQVVLQEVWKVV